MLVIDRKPGESFTVGDAKVTLVSSKRGKARIGVDAPRSTLIMREELTTQPLTRSRGDVPAEIAIKLVTALRMLAEGMQEPDSLFPEKYVKIIASKSHIEEANQAVAEYHDWLAGKGGAS